MAAAVDLSPILQNATSGDASLRNQAETQLNHFQQQNHAAYVLSLATELAKSTNAPDVRQIAGLVLKNTVDAPSDAKKAELVARYTALDDGLKAQIRQLLLSTLASDAAPARHTAALVIAKVAAIELPRRQWPGLIPGLLANMAPGAAPALKQSTLETLGYVCEEMGNVSEDVLEQEQVNSILTAVVAGMRGDGPDAGLRLAATVALYNALEFAQTNFENAAERNFIMRVICEGTGAEDARVREASLECLVKIAAAHYEKLPPYMGELFGLTQRAAGDEEDVAKQAIEFWCTICEEEADLQQEEEEGDSAVVNHHFVRQALSPLAAMLLEQLTKQEEGQDENDTAWNLSMAAGTCLGLAATVVGDDILAIVMPFVEANISKNAAPEDWRAREAATFAFGLMMEGPSLAELERLVTMGLPFLLNALTDTNPQVRHTTAWTVGRIFEFAHTPTVVTVQSLSASVSALLIAIRDAPHIAEKVCYALSQLAAGFKGSAETSLLSPFFPTIIAALLETAERPAEGTEALRLQAQAFEAVNEAVRSAAGDTLPLIAQLVPHVLRRLNATLHLAAPQPEARERQSELQGLLCGVLQVIVQKLSEGEASRGVVLQFADAAMEALLGVFACRHASVHEEAMLVVGALTYACGPRFNAYMARFFPILEMGLANHQEWQVCQVTVGVVGDVCRAIEEEIFPYADKIVETLLSNLQSPDVQRTIKPQILSAFGDLAIALGDRFEKYLKPVLDMLVSAQGLSVMQQQSGDEDTFEYNSLLRHGIFEAYSGLLNGLSRAKCDQWLKPVAPGLLDFQEYVFADKDNVDEAVVKASVALLGDLALNVSAMSPLFGAKPYIQALCQEASVSGDASLAESAQWAINAVNAARSGA